VDLLASKFPPVRHRHKDFFTRFRELAAGADRISLAVGYVSTNSLLFLKENSEAGRLPDLFITIGMHAFDRFSESQYFQVKEFAEALENNGRGGIYICTAFPFHGKLYLFWSKGSPAGAIMGSSNLSGLEPNRRIFELDIEIQEAAALTQLASLDEDMRSNYAENFLAWDPSGKFKPSDLMNNVPDTAAVSQQTVLDVRARIKAEYRLPLKCEQKSNLNVYYGKGRETKKTGLIRPRPWYEIEIIVEKGLTALGGYPRHRDFDVITDDGWQFTCYTGGTNSKNLRTRGNLQILGTWIKGRLQEAGKLKIGERVRPGDLEGYGRSYISLCSTDDPDLWFMSFDRDL